ncbi:MAG: hypothetical protein CEN91_439, partial [Candidatus Berkelbacteria bacterium Licking1014_85]
MMKNAKRVILFSFCLSLIGFFGGITLALTTANINRKEYLANYKLECEIEKER